MTSIESTVFPGPRPFFFGGWDKAISPCGVAIAPSPVTTRWSAVRFFLLYLVDVAREVLVFRGAIFDVLTIKQEEKKNQTDVLYHFKVKMLFVYITAEQLNIAIAWST